ncbi:tail fiber protein [Flagellimonas sp. HMM57]|uniref:tail fiber protein n=1 Tax=unclassified Flagellimonas TaxID=2644544 RepID=UPI0013D512E3|nr:MULTISPECIES: tail fiber protein [unclassified Flagellimonas]UII77357.1 tail fiber protein [Flagellimonas sp. HMM57]
MKKLLLFTLPFTYFISFGQIHEAPNGNVGVGTTNPDIKLHVLKEEVGVKSTHSASIIEAIDSQLDLTSSAAGTWGSAINLIEGNGLSNTDIWSFARQTTNGNGDSSLRINFGNLNRHDNTSLATFKSNGNVGIGTASPDAKLTVKGKVHAEEVKVDLSVPGPDYVFKEDYELKSLEEVQDHIKKHGHLPNIPPAKEMEENGIELGEMNMKLLEKIEELTLYILEQERRLHKIELLLKHK